MPDVTVYNPRRKRRKATAKKRTHKRRRRRVVARSNPANPRRRRSRRARVHRGRRVRRNPRLFQGGAIMTAAMTVGGMAATEFLAKQLEGMLPADWKADPNVVRIGTKAAIGIGAPLILGQVKILPKGMVKWIAAGGAIVTLWDIYKTFVAPRLGLGSYEELQSYELGPSDTTPIGALVDDGGGAYGGSAY